MAQLTYHKLTNVPVYKRLITRMCRCFQPGTPLIMTNSKLYSRFLCEIINDIKLSVNNQHNIEYYKVMISTIKHFHIVVICETVLFGFLYVS